MIRFFVVTAVVLACAELSPVNAGQFANPGFESVDGAGALTDWFTSGTQDGTQFLSGSNSLNLTGGGGFSVPTAFQTFPANPGDTFDLTGFGLAPTALPAGATFGLLKIVFSDGTGDLQIPAANVVNGNNNTSAFPGVESSNFSNTGTTWQSMQATAIAPAGTTQALAFAIFVDESAGTVYFDDMCVEITPVPEPSSMALVSVLMLGAVAFRRRKAA